MLEEVRYVLEEHQGGGNGPDELDEGRPDGALVGVSEPAAGMAVGLAGQSRHDAIHRSTPASAVKGVEVRPDRSGFKAPVFHARRQNAGRRDFPLHVADRASLAHCSDGKVEASDASTDGQHAEGR